MITITLRGREIPLFYTTLEMKQIQEEVSRMGTFLQTLFGIVKDGDEKKSIYGEPEHLNALAKCIRILGNSGLEESGEEPDLTDRWVLRALRPYMINDMATACMKAMDEGMESEIPPKEEDGPVDVTLEKIQKKKERTA